MSPSCAARFSQVRGRLVEMSATWHLSSGPTVFQQRGDVAPWRSCQVFMGALDFRAKRKTRGTRPTYAQKRHANQSECNARPSPREKDMPVWRRTTVSGFCGKLGHLFESICSKFGVVHRGTSGFPRNGHNPAQLAESPFQRAAQKLQNTCLVLNFST